MLLLRPFEPLSVGLRFKCNNNNNNNNNNNVAKYDAVIRNIQGFSVVMVKI
jgi:hypothetical protein